MAVLSATQQTSSVMTSFRGLSVLQLIGLTFVAVVARTILRGIYRIYIHPLRRFPGPPLSAFTRLPHIIATTRGTQHLYAARLHEQYGNVVRISPDELSFVGTNAWRDIYGHGPKQGPGAPPPKYWKWYNMFPGTVDSLLTQADPAVHSRQRKVFLPAFSDRALTQQSPLFHKFTDKLVQVMQDASQEGKDVDMVRMFNFTTFDVMGDLCFGESLHMLDNAEYDPWVSSIIVQAIFGGIKASCYKGLIYAYYPIAAAITNLLFGSKINALANEHMAHSSTRVTKRLDKGRESEGVDIWSLVLNAENKGKGLTKDEMIANAQLFMTAGTETTATLLSGLTYLLLTPDGAPALRKLREEVRGAFTSAEDISMDFVQALPFLNACIKEGLRLYPPVPAAMPHRTPANGSTICDLYIPPQTTVGSPHFATYRSANMFKQPQDFIPERWTGDERFANDERTAFQPFSFGSRDCVGKNMAQHEMRLILAKVIYNFDLELCPESKGWADQPTYTIWQKKALMVKIKLAKH